MSTWTKDSMQALLSRNDKAVERAVLVIFDRQTADERVGDRTTEENGVGFSRFDAEFMSSIAKWLISGRTLTPKQLSISRNKIKRYWRQLCEIANENESLKPQRPAVPAQVSPMTEEEFERQVMLAELRANGIPDEMIGEFA